MHYKIVIFFSLVLCFVSCRKDKNQVAQTKLIGHAGAGMNQWNGMYHDNSLEGIKYALKLENCSGVELDVQISLDTTFWLFHDAELTPSTNATGCIANSTDLQIQATYYKTVHQEKITTLNQLIAINPQKEIVIDLKQFNSCNNTVIDYSFIQRGFEKLGLLPPNFKIKLNSISVYPFLKDLNCSLIIELESANEVSQAFNKPKINGLMFNASKISKDEIKNLQNMGFKIYLYEVRSVSRLKKEMRKNSDFILVDDLINSMIVI